MNRLSIVFLLIHLFNLSIAQTKYLGSKKDSTIPKAVFIIADGIPADVIERIQPPNLWQIGKRGAYSRAYVGGKSGTYTQTPTISAPGYTNLLTGTWAYKHNVWDNDHQRPNYQYPTIFRVFKTLKPTVSTAIFSTWIENRKTLLGEGLEATNHFKLNYAYDGYELDSIHFPHDSESLYLHHIDEHVIHLADSLIRVKGPDLSWIYLEYTDDVGHSKGTGKEFDEAIGLLDRQMKKISEAIAYREAHFPEKWLLLITTDHGRDTLNGAEHGNQSLRERTTWMILNKAITNAYFSSSPPAIVDIFPSLTNYLNLKIPDKISEELDGTAFIGTISIGKPSLSLSADSINLSWQTYSSPERLKIYITYTNHAKQGGVDDYQLLGSTFSSPSRFNYPIAKLSNKDFYKIVIKGKYNSVNIWKGADPNP